MKSIPAKFAGLLLLVCASRGIAAPPEHVFAVPSGSLDRAISQLAAQAGVDIGGAVKGLSSVRTRGVAGRMSTTKALDRLLAGSGYQAIAAGPAAFRIVKRTAPPTPPAPPSPIRIAHVARPKPPPPEPILADTIFVTANKRTSSRLRFAGSVVTVPPGLTGAGSRNAPDGLGGLARALPILQSTDLGSGRNKLFIRGVADSSFDGPTQATAAIYFGDVPLGYNGPDPNLSLYDVGAIEILEGPQGTLYGAGAIGGIIRLSPNPPDLSKAAGRMSLGVTATERGAFGHDQAGMINVPIVTDKLGLRGVVYHVESGGYIDDVRRGLHNINSTKTLGGRLDLMARPAGGWSVDGGVVYQTIDAPDSQYALHGIPGLARASRLAQPFEDDFLLAHLVVTKEWDNGVRLLSAFGWTRHERSELFDATGPSPTARPFEYTANNNSNLLTEEIRLSRSLPSGAGWVAGASILFDKDEIRRRIGQPTSLTEIVGVSNRTFDAALFGEGTIAATNNLLVTGGARLTRARTDSSPTIHARNSDFLSGKTSVRADPTIGLNWLVAPRLALFTRYQSGFRTGGISVAPGIGRVEDFDADTIQVIEAGARLERKGPLGLAGSASISYSRWSDIQADLVDRRGLPYTTNIGNGRLIGFEVTGDWVPVEGLRASFAGFFNDSRLTGPSLRRAGAADSALPDTPSISASAGLSYQWPFRGGQFMVDGTARYVGRSYIGARPLLHIQQGGYVDDAVTLKWARGNLGLSLAVKNLADARGDRFAIGNPFELVSRRQYTPLRPRNVRLGIDVGF